jgi:hypothetical protein
VKKLPIYGFCLIGCTALFILNGCASGFIKESLSNEKSLPKEMSFYKADTETWPYGRKYNLHAFYVGIITRLDDRYYGIVLDNARNEKYGSHKILLLIPSNKELSPIMEEYENNGKMIGSVDVVLQAGFDAFNAYSREKYSWTGYPRNIALGYYPSGPDRHSIQVRYRFGEGDNDVNTKPIVDRLAWESRSNLQCGVLYLLYPVAFVFDVVTFPIQYIGMGISFIIGGQGLK